MGADGSTVGLYATDGVTILGTASVATGGGPWSITPSAGLRDWTRSSR
jgi:hypothetical protein